MSWQLEGALCIGRDLSKIHIDNVARKDQSDVGPDSMIDKARARLWTGK